MVAIGPGGSSIPSAAKTPAKGPPSSTKASDGAATSQIIHDANGEKRDAGANRDTRGVASRDFSIGTQTRKAMDFDAAQGRPTGLGDSPLIGGDDQSPIKLAQADTGTIDDAGSRLPKPGKVPKSKIGLVIEGVKLLYDFVAGGDSGPGSPSGGQLERSSTVDPALSTRSDRAREIVEAKGEKLPENWQAHHKVPFGVMAGLPPTLQQKIADSGWKMDSPGNLMALPSDEASFKGPVNRGRLPIHSGSHGRKYDVDVRKEFATLEANHETMSPDQIKAEMHRIEEKMLDQITQKRYHRRMH